MSHFLVPAGSPSRGGDATVYVLDINQLSLPTLFFLFCSCFCVCLYDSLKCILFHKFSRQLSAFSVCSSGLISAVLVLFNHISLYEESPLALSPIFLNFLFLCLFYLFGKGTIRLRQSAQISALNTMETQTKQCSPKQGKKTKTTSLSTYHYHHNHQMYMDMSLQVTSYWMYTTPTCSSNYPHAPSGCIK